MSTEFSQSSTAIVRQRENLDWFDTMLDEQLVIRVHSKDVDGAFNIIEVDAPPFSGPPLHYHKDREESFEVIEGDFAFTPGVKSLRLDPEPQNSVSQAKLIEALFGIAA